MTELDEVHDLLDIAPLNARSVVLSVLLGLDPPALPVAALVELGRLFGIASGTVRTAISRMCGGSELVQDGGTYRLSGRMLDRKAQQDSGRTVPTAEWDNTWWTTIVTDDARTMTERRHFRSTMTGARMGEVRPDIWMRPANTDGPPPRPDRVTIRGALQSGDPEALAARLWDQASLEERAKRIHDALDQAAKRSRDADPAAVPLSITVSAACVRFLRTEPQLPTQLAVMPASAALRSRYNTFASAMVAHIPQLLEVAAPALTTNP
ncbi:MAG: PaaX domain-containing protein, C- domain protein [Acidimicrobiales bacterium]